MATGGFVIIDVSTSKGFLTDWLGPANPRSQPLNICVYPQSAVTVLGPSTADIQDFFMTTKTLPRWAAGTVGLVGKDSCSSRSPPPTGRRARLRSPALLSQHAPTCLFSPKNSRERGWFGHSMPIPSPPGPEPVLHRYRQRAHLHIKPSQPAETDHVGLRRHTDRRQQTGSRPSCRRPLTKRPWRARVREASTAWASE